MNHQANAPVHIVHERLGFGVGRGERFLAEHVQAALGGLPHKRGVGFAGRGDVERVQLFLAAQQFVEAGAVTGNAELGGPGGSPRQVGIDNRDHAGVRNARPRDQVMGADHARADQADAERGGGAAIKMSIR